jgi:hypothetical protein
MAYNNYFPAGYAGYYNPYQQAGFQQPMQQAQNQISATYPQQQNNSNNLVWVSGESGAKSYMIPANTTVFLMDSERDCFYLKSSDASGMPLPLRVFAYQEITAQNGHRSDVAAQQGTTLDYVTKAEFDAFRAQVDGILNAPAKQPKKKKEAVDDGESAL